MPTIEQARPEQLAAITELLRQSDLPPEGLAEHLASALVAREGAAVVGSAALECYGDAALLRSVAVAPAYRGQGLGSALVGGDDQRADLFPALRVPADRPPGAATGAAPVGRVYPPLPGERRCDADGPGLERGANRRRTNSEPGRAC